MKTSIFFVALVFAAAIAAAQTPSQTPPVGNSDTGNKLFVSFGCCTCHGYEGQGRVGPRIVPRPLPLAAFTAFVRRASDRMPAYPEMLVLDEDLGHIHAYLQWRPMPTPIGYVKAAIVSWA